MGLECRSAWSIARTRSYAEFAAERVMNGVPDQGERSRSVRGTNTIAQIEHNV
jgi:hypothetical protein